MARKKKEAEEGEAPAVAAKASVPKQPAAPVAAVPPPVAASSAGEQPKAKAKAKSKAEPKAETLAEVPAAKPKAKAKPKADAEPKAKAEAKAKSEPKAKAKAEAKAKAAGAEPKAKAAAEAQSKAEPKGKAEAKPKAKADAKAVPKAAAKASASTVVAAPVAAVEPDGDAGMEAVTRKRRGRKKKAEAEELAAPEPEELVPSGPTDQDLAHTKRIKSDHDKHHNDLYSKIQKELDALPNLSGRTGEEVTKDVVEQRKALEKIMAEVDETLRGVKISRPKNVNTGKIMEQMRELRICKNDDGTFTEETKKQMLEDLDKALSKSLGWESFKNFQTQMLSLKQVCEDRLKQNEELAKLARTGNLQRKIVARVAQNKGVKVEDLKEDSVVSLNVDLPPEVTMQSFLYKAKFEKQYGVVIDRPEGMKGSGKGTPAPPPKMLIVRGVEPEVSSCVQALKSLDLSDRKVITVTPKQAAFVMGQQQANARKIESEFKSVFLHSEKNQVTVYGGAKEVQACVAQIKESMPEEGATTSSNSAAPATSTAPSMTIDKDRARALIGANGKNVQRIETDTGTKIKVNIIRNEEEDTPATIKITGEKANQDKARDMINGFLKSLQVTLVEADPDVVSRLYDSAVKGKGKGKGKGGGDGQSRPSKFGELRDSSGLTVVKKAKGILLVGDKADVDKWKATLKECVTEAANMPSFVKLTFEQAKLWNTERIEAVQTATGAKLSISKRGRDSSLDITGTDEEKEKAKEEIQKIHDDLGCVATIENVSADGVRSLTAKGAGRVREVEQGHDVSIAVDRKTQAVRIMGSKSAVASAKSAVESLLNSAATNTTREVEIGQYEGRVIIGRGGTTVRHIKQATGLEDLQVEDGEGTSKKVVLRGSETAVDAAVEMVKEVLAKARDPTAAAAAEAAAPAEGSPKAAAGKSETAAAADKAGEDKSSAPSQAAAAAAEEKRQEPPKKGKGKGSKPDVNLESQELFPTLGSSNGNSAKKSKRQPKTAWNKAQDEGAGEDEEEEDAAGEDTAAEKADGDANAGGGEEGGEGEEGAEETDAA